MNERARDGRGKRRREREGGERRVFLQGLCDMSYYFFFHRLGVG